MKTDKCKPRLLYVSPVPPMPVTDGASLRVRNLTEALSEDWDIDIVCPRPAEAEVEERIKSRFSRAVLVNQAKERPERAGTTPLRHLKNIITVPNDVYPLNYAYSEEFSRAVTSLVRGVKYDSVLAFTAVIYGYYLSSFKDLNITVDACDSLNLFLTSQMGASKPLKENISLLYAYLYNMRYERKYLSRCRKLVVISERDRDWICGGIPRDSIHVVKNGVDADYFTPDKARPGVEDGLVVFTGVMNYGPNHDAMMYCLSSVWPSVKRRTPGARLRIVGKNPKPELLSLAGTLDSVEVTGKVDDIREAVRGAQVFLCTMRTGAGLKNKVLESLAMGIPVVTTSEGVQGIEFEDNETGFVADTPEALAEKTADLIASKDKRERFSRAGRKLVEGNYTWRMKGKELSAVLAG